MWVGKGWRREKRGMVLFFFFAKEGCKTSAEVFGIFFFLTKLLRLTSVTEFYKKKKKTIKHEI